MNTAIFFVTLRQFVSTWQSIYLIMVMILLHVIKAFITPDADAADDAFAIWRYILIWMLGSGIIGKDITSGTLLLVFARPVRRIEYVMAKWLSLSAAISLIFVFIAFAAAGISIYRHGVVPEWDATLIDLAESCLSVTGMAAVFLMISTIFTSERNMNAALFVWISPYFLQVAAQLMNSQPLKVVSKALIAFAFPKIDVYGLLITSPPSGYELFSFLSTVSLCLALAVFFMNGKELSYASTDAGA